MNKALLLDFDGVVCKSKTAGAKVAKRAGIYTWKKLNAPQLTNKPSQSKFNDNENMVSVSDAENICFNAYKGFGHTIIGLKALGFKDISLREYNQFVYNTIDYDKVRNEDLNDLTEVRKMIAECQDMNVQVYLFTNAPKIWYGNVLQEHGDILNKVIDIRDVLGTSEDDEVYLKPYSTIYRSIRNNFPNHKLYFVDDNVINMQHTLGVHNWINVLYCPVNKKVDDTSYMINDLAKISKVLKNNM